MKTEPTEIDREAAGLFAVTGGMRIGWPFTSVTVVAPKQRWIWERVNDGSAAVPPAIDTDDPANVGCMLAQVEATRPGQAVTIVDRLHSRPGGDVRRFAVLVEHDGAYAVTSGPTRGAALVAAMRELKKGASET